MTGTTPIDKTTWEIFREVWTEEDPTADMEADIRASTTRLKAIRSLGQLTRQELAVKSLAIGGKYVSTVASGTMTKMMYQLIDSLDKKELELDEDTKAAIATYLNALVTVVTASIDSAVRVTEGKDPVGRDSFVADMRDIYAKKAAAAAQESTDGGK